MSNMDNKNKKKSNTRFKLKKNFINEEEITQNNDDSFPSSIKGKHSMSAQKKMSQMSHLVSPEKINGYYEKKKTNVQLNAVRVPANYRKVMDVSNAYGGEQNINELSERSMSLMSH